MYILRINKDSINKQKGFNLIELMVVISIIALLVSAALLIFNSSRQKSRDARRVADAKQIVAALDLYYNNCNSYPRPSVVPLILGSTSAVTLFTGNQTSVVGPCGTNGGSSAANGGFGTSGNAAGTIIIRTIPTAPGPADSALCGTGNNNSYQYTPTNDPNSGIIASGYTLSFCVGAKTAGYGPGLVLITK